MRNITSIGVASVAAAVFLPMAGAAQDRVEAGRAIESDAYIRIWNGAGSLHVEGWDADSIAVAGNTTSGEFFLYAEPGAAKLGPEGQLRTTEADLVVRVPRGASLHVRTGSADVTLRDLNGAIDIYTVTGGIDARARPSNFYAESMGGDLTLRIESAVARARTGTGRIDFAGGVADLTLSTVSGAIDARAAGLRRGRLNTVEGALTLSADLDRAGALEIQTHSGDIRLDLPPDAEADFALSSLRGHIDVPVRRADSPQGSPATLRYSIGAGGAEVVARSYSGTIRVRPAPDG